MSLTLKEMSNIILKRFDLKAGGLMGPTSLGSISQENVTGSGMAELLALRVQTLTKWLDAFLAEELLSMPVFGGM